MYRAETVDGLYEKVQNIDPSRGLKESWVDLGIRPGEVFCYKVRATDISGLSSDLTAPVCAGSQNNVPPHRPTGLSGSGRDTFVDLTWMTSHDADLDGYRVYYRKSVGEWQPPIDVGDVTSYRVLNLDACTHYEFRLTAVDWGGLEYDPSRSI